MRKSGTVPKKVVKEPPRRTPTEEERKEEMRVKERKEIEEELERMDGLFCQLAKLKAKSIDKCKDVDNQLEAKRARLVVVEEEMKGLKESVEGLVKSLRDETTNRLAIEREMATNKSHMEKLKTQKKALAPVKQVVKRNPAVRKERDPNKEEKKEITFANTDIRMRMPAADRQEQAQVERKVVKTPQQEEQKQVEKKVVKTPRQEVESRGGGEQVKVICGTKVERTLGKMERQFQKLKSIMEVETKPPSPPTPVVFRGEIPRSVPEFAKSWGFNPRDVDRERADQFWALINTLEKDRTRAPDPDLFNWVWNWWCAHHSRPINFKSGEAGRPAFHTIPVQHHPTLPAPVLEQEAEEEEEEGDQEYQQAWYDQVEEQEVQEELTRMRELVDEEGNRVAGSLPKPVGDTMVFPQEPTEHQLNTPLDTPCKNWVEERGVGFVELVRREMDKRPEDVMARLRDLMEALMAGEREEEVAAVPQAVEGEEQEVVELEEQEVVEVEVTPENPEEEREAGEPDPKEEAQEGGDDGVGGDEVPQQVEGGQSPQGEDV